MNEKLEEVRAWAKDKIASGDEPPWAWYQYMKLIETIDAILGATSVVLHSVWNLSADWRG
jgi:hypothetical protein